LIIGMFRTIFRSSARACLFLHVRTHSQMQYYLNIANTRRAANEGALASPGTRRCANVVEIHPLSGNSLA
jgi:hypothetical protein